MKREKGHIPNRLRKYRILKGYSLKEVADHLGLKSIAPIDKWEKGFSFPNAANLISLASLYSSSEYELYPVVLKQIKKEIEHRKNILFSKKK